MRPTPFPPKVIYLAKRLTDSSAAARPNGARQHWKRRNSNGSRGQLPRKTAPLRTAGRCRRAQIVGHWEIDTVVGAAASTESTEGS